MSYIYTIPVPKPHVGIVIGNKFSTLKKNVSRFKVNIHFNKEEPYNNRPMPYFVVRGQVKNVHLCIIEIQRLIIISMTNENGGLKEKLKVCFNEEKNHNEETTSMRMSNGSDSPPTMTKVDLSESPNTQMEEQMDMNYFYNPPSNPEAFNKYYLDRQSSIYIPNKYVNQITGKNNSKLKVIEKKYNISISVINDWTLLNTVEFMFTHKMWLKLDDPNNKIEECKREVSNMLYEAERKEQKKY